MESIKSMEINVVFKMFLFLLLILSVNSCEELKIKNFGEFSGIYHSHVHFKNNYSSETHEKQLFKSRNSCKWSMKNVNFEYPYHITSKCNFNCDVGNCTWITFYENNTSVVSDFEPYISCNTETFIWFGILIVFLVALFVIYIIVWCRFKPEKYQNTGRGSEPVTPSP